MARVACLHHLDEPVTGFAGRALRDAGIDLDERRLPQGDQLPGLEEADGIVTFGGRQSARDAGDYAYLSAELDLLREAAANDVPVFGVCLGGQMLARALGADVRRMPRTMVAWREPPLLPAAADDPVFSVWPSNGPTLHWHEDEFDLPPGGVELMQRGGPGVEAFRHGACAWGIQFHPEADGPTYERWCDTAQDAKFDEAGVTRNEVRAVGAAHMDEQERAAMALFGAFASVVLDRVERTSQGAEPKSRSRT